VELSPDGAFAFDGVPEEAVYIAVGLPGYRLSEANASLEKLNRYKLLGRVDGDISGLIIQLEPGTIPRNTYYNLPSEQQERFVEDVKSLPTKTLHGVESGPR
jgi:hypothetical protein